jgi:hypothetical protein
LCDLLLLGALGCGFQGATRTVAAAPERLRPVSADKPGAGKMAYFLMLTRDEQAAAIRRLSSSGMSDYGIASATGLAVEHVRAILGDRGAA